MRHAWVMTAERPRMGRCEVGKEGGCLLHKLPSASYPVAQLGAWPAAMGADALENLLHNLSSYCWCASTWKRSALLGLWAGGLDVQEGDQVGDQARGPAPGCRQPRPVTVPAMPRRAVSSCQVPSRFQGQCCSLGNLRRPARSGWMQLPLCVGGTFPAEARPHLGSSTRNQLASASPPLPWAHRAAARAALTSGKSGYFRSRFLRDSCSHVAGTRRVKCTAILALQDCSL